MKKYTDSARSRFSEIAFLEGCSFLILLFIAMPLKYMAGMPEVVKITGWIHGILFMLYLLSLVEVTLKLKWGLLAVLLAFMASLIPFGTFVLDAQMRKQKGIFADRRLKERA